MWKITVQPDRPQITKWHTRISCCILKSKNTHSEYIIILLSYCSSGCTKAPRYNVIRTLPVLFQYGENKLLKAPVIYCFLLQRFSGGVKRGRSLLCTASWRLRLRSPVESNRFWLTKLLQRHILRFTRFEPTFALWQGNRRIPYKVLRHLIRRISFGFDSARLDLIIVPAILWRGEVTLHAFLTPTPEKMGGQLLPRSISLGVIVPSLR